MTFDIHELVREFDEEFGSYVQRHEKKVVAIPGALLPDEEILIVTDAKLFGAFREDVVVATVSRLLVVRRDGKRIDEYNIFDLSSVTLAAPDSLGSLLTLTIAGEEWKGHIKSEPAAIALAQTLLGLSVGFATGKGLPATALVMPTSASPEQDIWKLIVTSDRDYGTSMGQLRPNLLALPEALQSGEPVRAIVDAVLEGDTLPDIVVCTERRLLTIRRDGEQVAPIDLTSITSLTPTIQSRGTVETITISHREGKWQATIASPEAAKQFLRAVRTASKRSTIESKTNSEAFETEPAASTRVEIAESADIESSPQSFAIDIASAELEELTRQPLRSLSHDARKDLVGHLASLFSFRASKYRNALDALVNLATDEERLLCLVEINTDLKSTSKLLALTSEKIIIQGPRAGGLDEIALANIASIAGSTATKVGTELTGAVRLVFIDGGERRLSSIPNACIGPFVAAVESAISEQKDHIEPEVYQDLGRPTTSLADPPSSIGEPVGSTHRKDRPESQTNPSPTDSDPSHRLEMDRSHADIAAIQQEHAYRVSEAIGVVGQRYTPGTIGRIEAEYEAVCLDLDFGVTGDLLRRLATLDLLLRRVDPSFKRERETWRKEMIGHLRSYEIYEDLPPEYGITAQSRIDDAIYWLFDIDSGTLHDNEEITLFLDVALEVIGLDKWHEPNALRTESEKQGYVPTAIQILSEERRNIEYRKLATEIGDPQILVKGELAHLPTVMMPDEFLLWLASGILKSTGKAEKGGGFSLIALTDRRILILDKRFLGGVQTISIDLDRVNSVSGDTGLIIGTGSVRIQDGGDERHIGWMTNSTVQPFVTRVQHAIEARKQFLAAQQAGAIAAATAAPAVAPATPPPPPAPSPAPPASANSIADELEKLANLMERGILTAEEFAEQKAKLLNG